MIESKHDHYTHANRVFVQAVRSHGGCPEVLDVGCWNGTLGSVLKEDLDVIVDGIEKDPAQADLARRGGYRQVEVVDLDHDFPASLGFSYDFLLFGDVLEHLLFPDKVLGALLPRLKPSGRVICSLPNIAFLLNRITHLLGRWDYKDYGILDRTHLRFFTRRTMIELLENAGLRVVRVDGYVGLGVYPWIVREPLRWLGRVWPSLFAIQIVLEAVPCTLSDQSAPPVGGR